jgi:putative phage-type endonuclease
MFHNIEQNSPEWFELRKGKFTASTFKDLFMKETTQGFQDALYKVAYERLTNESPESFSNEWMQRGSELEPEAREWYELETYNKVHNGGFFEYSEWIGASPDGLIGDDGLIELKCPKYSTMIGYLIYNGLPKAYEWQVHGQLWVADRQWCDFVAYHPKLQPLIIRVERSKERDIELLSKLADAIQETQEIINKLKRVA